MHSSHFYLSLACLQFASANPIQKRDSTSTSSSDISTVLTSALGTDCDVSNIALPSAPTTLPAPTGTLTHILIGRGSQNYTCDLSNTTAVPVPVGALATLYDASCAMTASIPLTDLFTSVAYSLRTNTMPTLSTDPTFASRFFKSTQAQPDAALEMAITPYVRGHHFFTNSTTPRFDLNTQNGALGAVTMKKVASSNAPADAQDGSVAWLYLQAVDGGEQDFSEVYRVETVGGNAPATCKEAGQKAFIVKYAAQYFFYK